MALKNPPLTSSLRNRTRSEVVRSSPSAVRICSGLPPMKRSPIMPALSTPGSDSICSSTRL
jgi:hypothetical protein